jgi:hypothetical protein
MTALDGQAFATFRGRRPRERKRVKGAEGRSARSRVQGAELLCQPQVIFELVDPAAERCDVDGLVTDGVFFGVPQAVDSSQRSAARRIAPATIVERGSGIPLRLESVPEARHGFLLSAGAISSGPACAPDRF